MEEESSKHPQQKSVQDKKGAMRKCRFSKKFGYMDAIIVSWGLTVGLMCFGMYNITINPGTLRLNELVDCKEDDKGCSSMEKSLLIELIMVGIFIPCQFLVAWEVFARPPKPGAKKILTPIRICTTCCVLMLTVDFVGVTLGYPDTKIPIFVILLAGILEKMFGIVMLVWVIYRVNENNKEEKRILEEEAKVLEQASADKIETV